MVWNAEEGVGVTIRCIADCVGFHAGIEDVDRLDGFAGAVDRVLAPLYPDVVRAYNAYAR